MEAEKDAHLFLQTIPCTLYFMRGRNSCNFSKSTEISNILTENADLWQNSFCHCNRKVRRYQRGNQVVNQGTDNTMAKRKSNTVVQQKTRILLKHC